MQKKLLYLWVIFFFISCSNSYEGDLIITNTNIVNVENGAIAPNQDIVIIGDSIAEIVSSKSGNTFRANQIIDGTDKYLIPGLWDMHTHTWWGYEDFFPLLLAHGITGVREMFGNLDVVNKLKKDIQSDSLIGPDIVSAGSIICGDPPSLGTCVVAKTAEEGRKYVREQKAAGADFIKTYYMLENDVYMAIADECKKQDIVLTGHIPLKVSLREALDVGHASIEHFYGILDYCSDTVGLRKIDEERTTHLKYSEYIKRANHIIQTYDSTRENEVIDLLVENNAWVCPTFTVHKGFIRTYEYNRQDDRKLYMPEYAVEGWFSQEDSVLSEKDLKNLKVEEDYYHLIIDLSKPLIDNGVKFLVGSDYPNPNTYPGFSLHEELQIFVSEVGLSTLQALQAATINPAIYFGQSDKLGTVSERKRASLVLLNKNPLDDIRNTGEIEGVILRGKYMKGDSLRAEIEKIAAKNRLDDLQ